jgi:predicted nucleic acid-binding protein
VSFLVDTNIVSEIRKGPRADRNVAAWFAAVPDASLYLSVLVLGEIRRGVELKRPQDRTQAAVLESWLATVQREFGGRILAVDSSVADEWGRMSAVRPVSIIDGLMAATAKVHGFTLVTRNAAHVTGLGVAVLNPFEKRV